MSDPEAITTTTTLDQPIDEVALRSSRFREGTPVTLCGQTFYLPKPRIRFEPTFVGPKLIENRASNDLGPDFASAMEALDGDDEEATAPFLDRLMMVGAALLLYNYDLPSDMLGRLLTYEADSGSSIETWNTIVGTARGTSYPKVTTGS